MKFATRGSVTLHCEPTSGESGWITFEVRDTGLGFDPARAPDLFEPFVQADDTTERRFGGTGLGLAISKQVVELLGGTTGADSTPGAGSVFWAQVPMPPVATGPRSQGGTIEPGRARSAGPGAGSGVGAGGVGAGVVVDEPLAAMNLLVVEDNAVNSTLIGRMLTKLGARVRIEHDGQAALAAIAESQFAAVLMDCQMPVLDGYDATRQLRRREEEAVGGHRRVPVIALTASALESDRQRCIEAGMDDFMTKPVTAADLRTVLSRYTEAAE